MKNRNAVSVIFLVSMSAVAATANAQNASRTGDSERILSAAEGLVKQDNMGVTGLAVPLDQLSSRLNSVALPTIDYMVNPSNISFGGCTKSGNITTCSSATIDNALYLAETTSGALANLGTLKFASAAAYQSCSITIAALKLASVETETVTLGSYSGSAEFVPYTGLIVQDGEISGCVPNELIVPLVS
jgi:hypothetical protein